MADEKKKGFNIRRYYGDLAKLFQGGPTIRHRVANKVAAPGEVGVPIGTARAFLRHVNNSYASALASYGQYNRLARYSDYNEMECGHATTLVYTIEHGLISMKDLCEMYQNKEECFHVYSYDHKNKEIVIDTAFNPCPTKFTQTYKVSLDDGGYVIATDNHPFMLRDGSYRQLKELKIGDSLMPLYRAKFNKNNEYIFVNTLSGKGKKNNRRWQTEHVFVSEQMIGRSLEEDEVVHHYNFKANDNRIVNLKVMKGVDHRNLHGEIISKHNKEMWTNENFRNKFSSNHSTFMTDNNPSKKNDITYKVIYDYCDSMVKRGNKVSIRKLCKDLSISRPLVLRRIAENGFTSLSDFAKYIDPSWKSPNRDYCKMPNYRGDVSFELICNNFKKGVSLSAVSKKIKCSILLVKKKIMENGFKDWNDFSANYVNHKVVSIEPYDISQCYDLTTKTHHNFAVCGDDKWIEKDNGTKFMQGTVFVHNSMAEIGSALDIYSDETCSESESGDIIKVESPNKEIKTALTELFYDVLNIEFNAFNWIRNLCKYGDQFFLLDHHPDYGVLQLLPMPVNEVEREEGFDPENPLRYRYRWVTQGNRVLEPWQVIHFRLMANDNFLPYGSSILEPARRVWRQLILMEDAVMVYRIVRSPERRVFYIGVGNVAPADIPGFMEKAKTQLKRNQIVDTDTGRVDLRYNALSTDEDYFIPVRGEGDGTRIETLPGGQFTGDIEDLQYIQNKLFAALKIPKSYLGYEQDISGKATLSQEDVRFSRTIKRVQRVFVAELNKIAIIHLFSMGYDKEDLVNFEITMANPSTIAELQRLELWRSKFEVASVAQEGMFDRNFIYKRIWNLNDEDIEQLEEGKRKDRMFDLEIEAIQAPAGAMPAGDAPVAPPGGEGEAPPVPDAGGGEPPPAPPEAGLPPPPGEEGGAPPVTAGRTLKGKLLTSHRDPNAQVAAPRELMMTNTSKKQDDAKLPNLFKYAFGTDKTAMDPKRSRSELTRTVRAPFGEDIDPEVDQEEKVFKKNIQQVKKFTRELENIDVLIAARHKKTKKILL